MKTISKILALTVLMASSPRAFAGHETPSADHTWLDRPWEIRYILTFLDEGYLRTAMDAARIRNATSPKPGHEADYLSLNELSKPTVIFRVPGSMFPKALVLIKFDKTGRATGTDKRLSLYTAKRNMLDHLVLARTGSASERLYLLAYWSQGIPGAVQFSPAVCSIDDSSRYDNDWQDGGGVVGGFGCREWTAQLYDWERPYIDVTSYTKTRSFIDDFIGWSRFTDQPKPVIGLHEGTWLCLHECPAGEQPGIIPDIKAWTAKHHFPMPQRPRKQPEYPNADYMDDMNE